MVKAIVSASIWFSFIVFSCCFVPFWLSGGTQAFFRDLDLALLLSWVSTIGFASGYFIRKLIP